MRKGKAKSYGDVLTQKFVHALEHLLHEKEKH